MGAEGLIYGENDKIVKISNPKNIEVVDVNGAGDIFTSALVYAENSKLQIDKTAKFAQLASVFKLSRKGTSPDDFSLKNLRELSKIYYPEISKGDFFYE